MTGYGERQVALSDGRLVSNYSEEYRAECEARAVCNMRRKVDRRIYMARVELKRGAQVREELERLVRLIWKQEFCSGS